MARPGTLIALGLVTLALFIGYTQQHPMQVAAAAPHSSGQDIFRFNTLGDEQLWTDVLGMQKVISHVRPATALSVGLKVDSDALPPSLIQAIKAGQVNLNDPAVTVQLLKLN